jgi:anti-sigma B factor antagonist
MPVTRRTRGAIEVAEITGAMDAASATAIRDELRAIINEGKTRVAIDLDAVRFVDSNGLFALVSVFKAARVAGGNVVLLRLQPQVRSVVELTRLHRVFEIFDDESAAVARLETAAMA